MILTPIESPTGHQSSLAWLSALRIPQVAQSAWNCPDAPPGGTWTDRCCVRSQGRHKQRPFESAQASTTYEVAEESGHQEVGGTSRARLARSRSALRSSGTGTFPRANTGTGHGTSKAEAVGLQFPTLAWGTRTPDAQNRSGRKCIDSRGCESGESCHHQAESLCEGH